jgi:hypothetical protein
MKNSKKLELGWITEGLIDFEYKKYQLLAYLKSIEKYFLQSKLYPSLSDLIEHYNNLIELKENKNMWFGKFPKKLKKVDLEKIKLYYEQLIEDDATMKEIDDIIGFAIPNIKKVVTDGTEIYNFVERNVKIAPVGIMPLYKNEGYIFLHQAPRPQFKIFKYSVSIFEQSNEKFRSIRTSFIEEKKYSRFVTLESEKIALTKKFTSLPNPATYFITSSQPFPERETFLPIAKRYLIQYISNSTSAS